MYSAQGSYIITVTVENAYSIPVSVSKVVQVVSAPGYIHDNCPKAWEVGVEGTCLITISQGSEMTANIDATLLAESANIQLAVEGISEYDFFCKTFGINFEYVNLVCIVFS